MKYTVVKRKGASIRELGREDVELNNPRTLEDLLKQLCAHELQKTINRQITMQTGGLEADMSMQASGLEADPHTQPSGTQIAMQTADKEPTMRTGVGKIDFGVSYNDNVYSLDKALEVMLQDFEDGLFRIYMNGEEYTDLNEELRNQEENEIVIIKLVMMAGRLW